MRQTRTQWIIGIDEVGRGPLAGPVIVAGIKIKKKHPAKIFDGIKDSKRLSRKKREEWYAVLTTHHRLQWAVARVYPRVIDRINIAQAANRAATRVASVLWAGDGHMALLDGGLSIPRRMRHEVIIKGDEKVPVIAAASIIAKVTRDRYMLRTHKKYPEYRFDLHKGYGTRLHREMIRRYGQCEIHRKSFHIEMR